jgi:hypothetical protein
MPCSFVSFSVYIANCGAPTLLFLTLRFISSTASPARKRKYLFPFALPLEEPTCFLLRCIILHGKLGFRLHCHSSRPLWSISLLTLLCASLPSFSDSLRLVTFLFRQRAQATGDELQQRIESKPRPDCFCRSCLARINNSSICSASPRRNI